MGKKDLLAMLLFGKSEKIVSALSGWNGRKNLYILAYHRIYDYHMSDYPFDKNIISADVEMFDKQMEYLSRNFNVINFYQLKKIVENGKQLPKDSVIVTFDDGYADNYESAYNILKKYGLTATIFVATAFMQEQKPYWFEKVAYLLNKAKDQEILLNGGEYKLNITKLNKEEIKRKLGSIFSQVPYDKLLQILDELYQQINYDISDEEFSLIRPLSEEQIKILSDNGIEIASHTVNHPFLGNMSDEQIYYELAHSKKILQGITNREVISIGYPFGSFDNRVMNIAEKCGYEFGISYEHKVKKFDPVEKFALTRIRVETYIDLPLFKGFLRMPKLFVR